MTQSPYTNTMTMPNASAGAAAPRAAATPAPSILPADAGLWGLELERPAKLAAAIVFVIVSVGTVASVALAPDWALGAVVVWTFLTIIVLLAPYALRFWVILRMYNLQMQLLTVETKLRDMTLQALATPGGAGGSGERERDTSQPQPGASAVMESWVKMLLFVAQRATHTPRSPRGGADNPEMKGVRPGGGNVTLDAELYSMLCHVWRGIKYLAPVDGVAPSYAMVQAHGIPVMEGGDETGQGKRGASWRLGVDFEQAAYALRLYFTAGKLPGLIDAVRQARGGKLPL